MRLRSTSFFLLSGIAFPLVAQGTQTAQVTGFVHDAKGHPIAQVVVRLSSPSLQGSRSFLTDGAGQFVARMLPPGNYHIEVSREGLQTFRIEQRLGLGQTWSPRFAVAPVEGTEVAVVASRPEADVAEVKTASNLRMEEINMLAMERGATDVLKVSPGVLEHPNGFLIRGGLSTSNLFLVDGQNVQDNLGTVNSGLGAALIEDSIEEYQVLRGALPVEYGGVDGGVMNTVTRSGGNLFTAVLRTELKNDAVGAAKPYEDRASVPDVWRKATSLAVGGYLIKDKLWFFATGYTETRSDRAAIAGDALSGPGAGGTTYASNYSEKRVQGKLTWAMNQDQTLVLAFNRSHLDQGDMNPGFNAGEMQALVPYHYEDSFANLSWRATWTDRLVTEARIGQKHLFQRQGGYPTLGVPVVDLNSASNFTYQNGRYDARDGGDTRDNHTANLKASLLWDAAGSHQTDFGMDWLSEENQAPMNPSPTGTLAFAKLDVDSAVSRLGTPDHLAVFQTAGGKASIDTIGLYAGDRWLVDPCFTVQAGLRWDRYAASDENGTRIAASAGISPRLGLKYDLFADARWVLGLSAARYIAKIPAAILYQTTHQYNPSETDYAATGTAPLSFAQLGDPANYARGTVISYASPSLTRIKPNLKAPRVDELQASAAYAFKAVGGEGFVRLTGVIKEWHDLVDWRIGNDGTGEGPAGGPWYLKVWDNTNLAKRSYQSLEWEAGFTRGPLNLAGNLTWSRLRGNYAGEGAGAPASGEGLQNFTTLNGQVLYDSATLHPYGYLPGDVPLRLHLRSSYFVDTSLGRSTFGLLFSHNSGAHYDRVRSADAGLLNAQLPGQFGSTFTQYQYNARGTGTFNATSQLDLAYGQDFKALAVGDQHVRPFLRLLISNVFNHQQAATFNTSYRAAGSNLNEAWIQDPSYGKSDSPDYYSEPRGIQIHLGIRF